MLVEIARGRKNYIISQLMTVNDTVAMFRVNKEI